MRFQQLAIHGEDGTPWGSQWYTGPLLESVQTGTNAEIIRRLAPLYLNGHVCDVTYGEGKWWSSYRPERFTYHDLHKIDGVDFRNLPERDGTYDTVVFDPPYVPTGGIATSTVYDFRDRFGLEECDQSSGHTSTELAQLFTDGIRECCRVVKAGGYIITKSADSTGSSELWLGHVQMIKAGKDTGLKVHDLIVHHSGTGPGGHNIAEQKRARRAHSYFIVFRKPGGKKQ